MVIYTRHIPGAFPVSPPLNCIAIYFCYFFFATQVAPFVRLHKHRSIGPCQAPPLSRRTCFQQCLDFCLTFFLLFFSDPSFLLFFFSAPPLHPYISHIALSIAPLAANILQFQTSTVMDPWSALCRFYAVFLDLPLLALLAKHPNRARSVCASAHKRLTTNGMDAQKRRILSDFEIFASEKLPNAPPKVSPDLLDLVSAMLNWFYHSVVLKGLPTKSIIASMQNQKPVMDYLRNHFPHDSSFSDPIVPKGTIISDHRRHIELVMAKHLLREFPNAMRAARLHKKYSILLEEESLHTTASRDFSNTVCFQIERENFLDMLKNFLPELVYAALVSNPTCWGQ